MSLILDALNRSQRDSADPTAVPGLASPHYADSTAEGGGWRQAVLVAALAVALAVIAWLLWGPGDAETGASARTPLAASPATGAGAGVPAGSPALNATAPAAPPGISGLAPAPADRGGKSVESVPDAEVAALYASSTADDEAQVEPKQQEAAVVETPRESEQVGQTAPTDEQPVDVAQLLRAARAEMGSSGLTEHPAPMLAELSQQRKDAIPTLLYSAHDFRGQAEESQVLINGREARAGDEVARGVTVTEVLPDSVVLRFDGETFRLKALNSWVNL